jgi:plasmanylethanolamine desaturase
MFISKFVFVVLLSDLITGLVHWAEDTYARPDHKWLGWIGRDNLLHHHQPRAFLVKNWFQSSWDLLLIGAIVIAVASAFDRLTWEVWLFVALTVNANQFHKWTHRASREKPLPVIWLQKLYVLQTARHHGKHHHGEKNSHYCVITNFLNPILEEIEFWRRLETFNRRVFGWIPRDAAR